MGAQPLGIGPLIAREAELARLSSLLASEPLVTLRGTAGVGKSRLAMEAVRASTGSVVVALEGVRDRVGAVAAIAGALDLAASVGEPVRAIERALSTQRPGLVMLLDGADAVAHEIAPLVAGLVASCPSSRWLVTSRVALGISGEVVVDVAPLEVPPPSAADPSVPALAFLCDRVLRSGGTFSERDLPSLAQLTREVGGIPWALELVAARVALLGVHAALRGSSSDHPFLATAGAGSDLARSIHGSLDLLTDAERTFLVEIGALPQPVALDVIEALTTPVRGLAPIDLLQGLRSKSLVRTEIDHEVASGEARYYVYEHVRAVLHEGSSAIAADIRGRHAVWLADAARVLVANAESQPLAASRAHLLVEPLRALATSSDAARALAAVDALVVIAACVGPLEPAADALDKALAREDLPAETVLRLRAARLQIATWLGRAHDGSFVALEALLGRDVGDVEPTAVSRAWDALGVALLVRGDVRRSLDAFERGLTLAVASGSPREEVRARCSLGLAAMELGRPDLARDELTVAYERALAAGLARSAARALIGLGGTALDEGAVREADVLAKDLAALAERLGDTHMSARASAMEGAVAHLEGRLDDAIASYTAAGERFRRTRPRGESVALGYIGIAHWERGERASARRALEQAIEGLEALGDHRYAHLYRGVLGGILGVDGEEARAKSFLDKARSGLANAADPFFPDVVALIDATISEPDEPAELVNAEHPPCFELEIVVRALRASRASAASSTNRVEIDRAGRFVAAQGRRTDLEQRPSLRLIVAALVHALEHSPSEPLSWQRLRDAGWPGERMRDDAARQRVRTALATLRRLGLRDVLSSDLRGWYLAPDAPVTIVS